MTDPVLALVGIALAFFGLDALRYVREWLEVDPLLPDDGTGTLGSDLLKWTAAGLLVGWVLVVEKRPLSSIGVEWMAPLPFVTWVVGGVVLTMVAGSVTATVYNRLGLRTPLEGGGGEQLKRSFPARTLTVVTAGVTESVLYQGYPIERLTGLLESIPATSGVALPVAGAVAFLAFTGAHYTGDSYSLEEAVFIAVPALSMTVLYVLTRNLLVVMAAHTLVDGIMLLGPGVAGAVDDGETTVSE